MSINHMNRATRLMIMVFLARTHAHVTWPYYTIDRSCLTLFEVSMVGQCRPTESSSSLLGSRKRSLPTNQWLGESIGMPAASKLACLVLSSARSCPSSICSGRLSAAWLVSRVVFSYGLHVEPHEVHRSSLWRIMCHIQDYFIFLTLLVLSMTFVLSLNQMFVFLSLYVMLIIFGLCGRTFVLCLFVQWPAATCAIAGGTQELYTCLYYRIIRTT